MPDEVWVIADKIGDYYTRKWLVATPDCIPTADYKDLYIKKSESVSKKDIEKLMYELEQEMTREESFGVNSTEYIKRLDSNIKTLKNLLEPKGE